MKRQHPLSATALPFLHIIGVFLFNGHYNSRPVLDIYYTIVVGSIFVGAIIDCVVKKFDSEKTFFEDTFLLPRHGRSIQRREAMLLVAAGVFAQGLMSISCVDNLISLAESAGAGGIALILILTGLTVAAAIATRFW
ncbi:hypothetical protein O9992_29695 [Vibrio lentus]|nr:hypothetical protein [Vibrio lentus]